MVALSLLCLSHCTAQPVIKNPSFEEVDEAGAPVGWNAVLWGRDDIDREATVAVVELEGAPDGKRVARTSPGVPVYSAWAQGLDGMQPGQWYELSGMVRCEELKGQGCHINVEYWRDGNGFGCVDAEHLVGTVDWTRQSIRFQAPGPDFNCIVSLFNIGGPGTVWFDDIRLGECDAPTPDLSDRTVLEGSFWGMFTCYARYLHELGEDMQAAGVYWQRQGLSASAPEQQEAAERLGMAFAMCIDGMPPATDENDPCYPVSNSREYVEFLQPALEKAGPSIRAWEFFNEPNTHLDWALPGYANLVTIAGKAIKERHPEALIATGGFAPPELGYAEGVLKRDTERVIDLVLLHPYAVDEALDSALFQVAEACERAGRPDVAVAINETGWATWDPATGCEAHDRFVTEAKQAEYVVKMHVQALAHRLSFVAYLGWNDFTEPSDHARNMGLVRLDGTPKPSHRAYTFMTRTIGDRRVADWRYRSDGTRTYRFDGGPTPLWVTWNALRDANTTINVGETPVFPCDMYGARLTRTPVSGKVRVEVGSEPVYLVGE